MAKLTRAKDEKHSKINVVVTRIWKVKERRSPRHSKPKLGGFK